MTAGMCDALSIGKVGAEQSRRGFGTVFLKREAVKKREQRI